MCMNRKVFMCHLLREGPHITSTLSMISAYHGSNICMVQFLNMHSQGVSLTFTLSIQL